MITGIAAPGNWDREESMLGVRGGAEKDGLVFWKSPAARQGSKNCQGKVTLSCGHVFNWWDVRISETIPKSSQLNDSLIVTEHCCLAGSLSLAFFWSVLSLSPPVLPSVPGPLKNSSHSSALKACNKTEQREWDIDALFQNPANRLPRQHVKASQYAPDAKPVPKAIGGIILCGLLRHLVSAIAYWWRQFHNALQ